MAARLAMLDARATADEVAAAVLADGAAVVEGYVARDRLAAIRAELAPHVAAAPRGRDAFTGFRTRRVGGLIVKSPAYAGLLVDPLALGVCDRVLLPGCSVYQLSYTQAIEIAPGEPAQPLHQDDASYRVPAPRAPLELLCALAVTDFTAENGATRLVLGSHRWPAARAPEPAEAVPAVMAAGSLAFFLGSTWHGGGANRAAAPRLGALGKYCLGHLRQEENQFLIAPPPVARALPPALRALIGYRVCPPFLGGVLEPELMDLFPDVPAGPARRG